MRHCLVVVDVRWRLHFNGFGWENFCCPLAALAEIVAARAVYAFVDDAVEIFLDGQTVP